MDVIGTFRRATMGELYYIIWLDQTYVTDSTMFIVSKIATTIVSPQYGREELQMSNLSHWHGKEAHTSDIWKVPADKLWYLTVWWLLCSSYTFEGDLPLVGSAE